MPGIHPIIETMSILNIEFKAKTTKLALNESRLVSLHPLFIGEDNQTDTYFEVPKGRLKLREGNIENSLIYYERIDTPGIKRSDVLLYSHQPDKALKDILEKLHGIKTIVIKSRRIYFIDNVKFHFDKVEGLGSFIEVEAIDKEGTIGMDHLKEQCNHYQSFFEIREEDFMSESYSDLLLNK